MTIVVFFEDAAIGALARDRIRMLASKHPSRVVVLDAAQDATLSRVETGDWIELGVKGRDGATMHSAAADAASSRSSGRAALDRLRHRQRSAFCSDARRRGRADRLQQLAARRRERRAVRAGRVRRRPSAAFTSPTLLICGSRRGKRAWRCYSTARRRRSSRFAARRDYLRFEAGRLLSARLAGQPSPLDRRMRTARSPIAATNRSSTRYGAKASRDGLPGSRCARRARSSSPRWTTSAETIRLSVTGSSKHPLRYRAVNNPGIAALVERAILWGHNDRIFADSLAAAGKILGCEKS